MTKIRKILLLLIIILLMISFSLAISYAYYQHSATNNPSQVVATIGGGDLALENETQITLMGDRSSPISDKKALSSDLYKMTFEVTNNSAYEYAYDIGIVPFSNTTINCSSIKYAIYKSTEEKPLEGNILGDISMTLSTESTEEINEMYGQSPTTGYQIREGDSAFSGTTVTYNLYVWVDYDEAGVNNSQMNKTFEGIVVLTNTSIYDRQGLYDFLNQKRANITSLSKLSTNLGNSIFDLSESQDVDINNVKSIYSVDLHQARPDFQNTNMAFFADIDNDDVIATWAENNDFFIGERNEVRPGPSMVYAFGAENNLTRISNVSNIFLANFNTSKVTNMANMFRNSICKSAGSLKNSRGINLGNHFNTSNVTDMSYMFSNIRALILKFHFGPQFNTLKVSRMCGMFSNTGSSISFALNLHSFTINNTSVDLLDFAYQTETKNITFGNGWANAHSGLNDNAFLNKIPTTVYYTDPSFHSYTIGNKTMWNRWRGNGNTTFKFLP